MSTKTCNKCNKDKELDKFAGRNAKCRECVNQQRREKRVNNLEEAREKDREYRKNNYEIKRKNEINYEQRHKEKRNQKRNECRLNNPEYMINYRQENKKELKEKRRIYESDPIIKEKINKSKLEYHNKKMEEDPKYVLCRRARTILHNFMKNKGVYKTENTFEFIGLDPELFFEWIQFNNKIDYIDFDNYHLDHFIPLSSFNITCEEDIYNLNCHHWTNLRPMLPEDNLEKSDKLPDKNEIFKMNIRIQLFKLQYNLL